MVKKGQGLPLNTIIIAIIVIIVLVVIILITTGQLAKWQETLRGGGSEAEMCSGPGFFCSPTGDCGATATINTGKKCPVGQVCCKRSWGWDSHVL